MKKTRGLLLAVAVAAMAFTFSCSSDGGSSGATYWYSVFGIADASSTAYIVDLVNQYENPSYNDVKYIWSEIQRIGTWEESYDGVSEQEMKDFLVQHGISPKDVDDWLTRLKKRGNSIVFFSSAVPYYHSLMVYVER